MCVHVYVYVDTCVYVDVYVDVHATRIMRLVGFTSPKSFSGVCTFPQGPYARASGASRICSPRGAAGQPRGNEGKQCGRLCPGPPDWGILGG